MVRRILEVASSNRGPAMFFTDTPKPIKKVLTNLAERHHVVAGMFYNILKG